MTGRDGRRAVRNVGGAAACRRVAVGRHRARRRRVRRRRHRRGLPQVPNCPRLPVCLARRRRGRPGRRGHRRRQRLRSGGGSARYPAVVAGRSVCRGAMSPRRRTREVRHVPAFRCAVRSWERGLRLRSRDRVYGLLDGRDDVTGDELERGRHSGGRRGNASAGEQEQRQANRRCRERDGEVRACDGSLQLHPGRPVGRNEEASRPTQTVARSSVLFQADLRFLPFSAKTVSVLQGPGAERLPRPWLGTPGPCSG